MKILTTEEMTQRLKENLTAFTSIAEAPTFSQLQDEADKKGISIERLMEDVAEIRYKASDKWGNIYLQQSPALMGFQMYQFISPVIRIKPKLVLAWNEHAENEPI